MHLAYSALKQQAGPTKPGYVFTSHELQLRYQAYQNACRKYSNYIAEIQQYIPGWVPAFR